MAKQLAALRARIRDVVANGSTPARKALLRALVHGIRVDARDHIQPVFRVPVPGSSATLTASDREDTEVHDPKVRALGDDVVLTTQYTNLSPLVATPPIRLTERHTKVRRDGYRAAGSSTTRQRPARVDVRLGAS